MRIVLGVVQWTLAIASALATLALFTWIMVMLLKRDR
jgi:hypothetical protein